MNDKTSQRPPSLYTREEEAMEQYLKTQGHGQDTTDISYDAGIETTKPSGMFRFGKALANAFKPFAAWSGGWKEKEKETSISPEKTILQERQAKATEAYAELKKSGYKGTQAYIRQETKVIPKAKMKNTDKQQVPRFRDSGIDMDDARASYEPNPNDQLIGLTEALLAPPPPQHRSTSPFSEVGSARKSSLHLRKPSLQGLKKVTSQIHLSPVKKQVEAPTIPSIKVENMPETKATAGFGLQRQPSRKDIAKANRLSKKVSDLENKLETARRELELSMSTVPPVPDVPSHLGRKPFKPGALPSLSSERNMSPQKHDAKENLPPISDHNVGRIAYDAHIFKPGTDIHDVLDLEAAKGSKRTRGPSGRFIASKNLITPTGVKKPLPKVPSKTPRNSPIRFDENVPPIPPTPANAVDPIKHVPSPSHGKVTDHKSVAHLDRAPSPFLGPPASLSPIRTRSKKSRRGVSPPPPSLASAKKENGLGSGDAADTPIKADNPCILSDPSETDVDPVKSEVPVKPFTMPIMGGDVNIKRPMLETQKEDFEWDDDVF